MVAQVGAQDTGSANRLPYGIGRFGSVWSLFSAILLAIALWGLFAYSRQFFVGEIVTGMRDIGTMGGAAWGLYIAFDGYFVGVSFAGITVAILIRLLHLDHLRPVSRIAIVLAVITLILGAMTVVADLGQPIRGIINLLMYARPQSPFFGTFTLVLAGYLFASLVYLYLEGRRDAALLAQRAQGALQRFYHLWAAGYRGTNAEQERHRRTTFWLAVGIAPLLITATSTLGFVFGIQSGRPGWFGSLQAPAFVVLAGVSGLGVLIVLAAVLRQALAAQDQLNQRVFVWLGNFLMVLTTTYIYFVIVELLTATYTSSHNEVQATTALLRGEYAWLYWLSVVCLGLPALLLFGQFLLSRYSLALIVLSGLLVNVAAIGKRYLIVVPSQTYAPLLPYPTGSYSPTWVEYSIVVGLFALGALLLAIFVKVFPIMEVPESTEGGR